MRHDFRIKMDFSKIFQDVRQLSWIYIDSTKIRYVNQLAEHVRKLFQIKKQFHLLSKFEEMYLFLPFEEDIRVLENNDTVLIVPGTGINDIYNLKNEPPSYKMNNGNMESVKSAERENNSSSEKSYSSLKSSAHNTIENIVDASTISNNLYTTAVHETNMLEVKDIKMVNDNVTEDNNIIKENIVLTKRKRTRKKKEKKLSDTLPESDTSVMEFSRKKPKIIDSVLISSGKHIRFKGLDDDDITSDCNTVNGNNCQDNIPNNKIINNEFTNNGLTNLLNLRQSSTPITFGYRKIQKQTISETIDENFKLMDESHNSLNDSQSNEKIGADTIYTFKVFKMGEDYSPQLSEKIVAKFLSYDEQESKYILKILHGKEQLQDPVGKFSLPKDEENETDEVNDIVSLEKSKLLDLKKVTAFGNTV